MKILVSTGHSSSDSGVASGSLSSHADVSNWLDVPFLVVPAAVSSSNKYC